MVRSSRQWLWILFATVGQGTALAEPPAVTHLFPPGCQRGTTIIVKGAGKFPDWPVTVHTDAKGLDFKPGKDSGVFDVTVAPEVEPGVKHVRFLGKDGVSTLKAFVIGTLPERNEAEPNNERSAALKLEGGNVVVNGALEKGGDVDSYVLDLMAGQTLVADVVSRNTLASPLDATLQIVSETGFVLAEVDDAPDLDPRIVFPVPSAGKFIVRVFGFPADPNQSIGFTGNASMIYRLTLSTKGFVEAAWPLVVTAIGPREVELLGPGVPVGTKVTVPVSPISQSVSVGIPEVPGVVAVSAAEHPVFTEANVPKEGALATPVTICGVIQTVREKDRYRFTAKKDQPLTIRVASRTLGFPLDPQLQILDPAGKVLASVDDVGANRDPETRWVPPADGEYVVEIRDLHGMSGDSFRYRCDITAPVKEFRLSVAADRFTMTAGETLDIPVTVTRLEGFAEPLQIVCKDLPEGITVAAVTSEPTGDSAGKVTLKLTAAAPMAPLQFQIVGKAGEVERMAEATVEGLSITTDRPWLSVLAPKEKK